MTSLNDELTGHEVEESGDTGNSRVRLDSTTNARSSYRLITQEEPCNEGDKYIPEL